MAQDIADMNQTRGQCAGAHQRLPDSGSVALVGSPMYALEMNLENISSLGSAAICSSSTACRRWDVFQLKQPNARVRCECEHHVFEKIASVSTTFVNHTSPKFGN